MCVYEIKQRGCEEPERCYKTSETWTDMPGRAETQLATMQTCSDYNQNCVNSQSALGRFTHAAGVKTNGNKFHW